MKIILQCGEWRRSTDIKEYWSAGQKRFIHNPVFKLAVYPPVSYALGVEFATEAISKAEPVIITFLESNKIVNGCPLYKAIE